jgi:glycosyltransferase involved in cell wall biosynthesis
MITVLHLIESLRGGGAERRLVNDIVHMNTDRFRNVVCFLFPRDDLGDELRAAGIELFCFKMSNPYDIFRLFREFHKIVLKYKKIDILHTHLFFSTVYGRVLARVYGIPNVITTIQYPDYDRDASKVYSSKRHIVDRWTARLNKGFIAVSEHVKNSALRELSIKSNITVIHNYISHTNYQGSDPSRSHVLRQSLGIKNGQVALINVGRLDPQKGHRYLIEAVKRIISRGYDIKLFIVGEGRIEKELKEIVCNMGLENRIIFLGQRKDIIDLMSAADIFVFPSLNEGLPLALLEAMAMGKVCVASDIPAIREIIRDGENGSLVKKEDAVSLENALLRILKGKVAAQEYIANAMKTVKSDFSPEINIAKLERYYEEIVRSA